MFGNIPGSTHWMPAATPAFEQPKMSPDIAQCHLAAKLHLVWNHYSIIFFSDHCRIVDPKVNL
jgi:hypothetical protein